MNMAELVARTYSMFKPPRSRTVSEWADENRILMSDTSSEPGRWRTDRAPYQREIMDAFTQPGIYEIVIMAGSQVGKSEIMLNMIGKAIEDDPCPMLYIQPTNDTAEDYSKRRIAPMISACPTLRQRVYEAKGRDSGNTIGMKMFPGGSLAIIGANSPSDLASKPIQDLFMDEIDRFPDSAGTEGNPIELAERRTETFRHVRRIVKASTPTIKGASKIEKAYLKGTQEEWQTECPHCHKYSYIRFDDVRFDKERIDDGEGKDDYIVRNTRWLCPNCKTETPEHDAKRLPARWVARNERALENGVRSFKLNAFMSPWSSWTEIARKFLQAKEDPELLKVWHNTYLGESWEIKHRSGAPEKLYAQREHYNAEVPDGVLVLTMGIDTQDNRLQYEVVGWNRNEESWGIEYGAIPGIPASPGVWEEVDGLLDKEWQMQNGMRLRIMATFIDSGGHYTPEIYKECAKRSTRRIWAIKGKGGDMPSYVVPMKNSDRTNVRRYLVATDAGKEAIMHAASLTEPGNKYMHFPIAPERGYDMEYFRGLCSETLITKRKRGQTVQEWEKTYERNEPLDCRNYARAAYKGCRWNFDRYERILTGSDIAEKAVTREQAEKRKPKLVISTGIKL